MAQQRDLFEAEKRQLQLQLEALQRARARARWIARDRGGTFRKGRWAVLKIGGAFWDKGKQGQMHLLVGWRGNQKETRQAPEGIGY